MTEGKDARGRFLPGHKYGGKSPGRPRRAVEEKTYAALAAKYSNDTLSDMMDRLAQLTSAGDLGAIKLVLAYLIGQPVQRSENAATDELAELLRQWRYGTDSDIDPVQSS